MKNNKISNEKLDEIGTYLSNVACQCDFMREEANIRQFAIGCYSNNDIDLVICHLQSVMRYYEPLIDRLNLLSATLDGLLVQSRVIRDSEV